MKVSRCTKKNSGIREMKALNGKRNPHPHNLPMISKPQLKLFNNSEGQWVQTGICKTQEKYEADKWICIKGVFQFCASLKVN